jgi:hypothetical protein
MSTGLDRIQASNEVAHGSAWTRPPLRRMASASAMVMPVSSVTCPARNLSQPPPMISQCVP